MCTFSRKNIYKNVKSLNGFFFREIKHFVCFLWIEKKTFNGYFEFSRNFCKITTYFTYENVYILSRNKNLNRQKFEWKFFREIVTSFLRKKKMFGVNLDFADGTHFCLLQSANSILFKKERWKPNAIFFFYGINNTGLSKVSFTMKAMYCKYYAVFWPATVKTVMCV